MLNLNFKQGLSNNLPNVNHNPGTIYLLTDLNELYYDQKQEIESVPIVEDITFVQGGNLWYNSFDFINYAKMEGTDMVEVIFDNKSYILPVFWYVDTEYNLDTCFYFGADVLFPTASEYPFGVQGYKGSSGSYVRSDKGSHTISIRKVNSISEPIRSKITDTDLILFDVENSIELDV